jgi:hypothetical protein
MMHEPEKSDSSIVAMKLANNSGRPEAESVERREETEGSTGKTRMRRTPSRGSDLASYPHTSGVYNLMMSGDDYGSQKGRGTEPSVHK